VGEKMSEEIDETIKKKIEELRELHEKLRESKEYPVYMIRDKISEIIKIYEALLNRNTERLEIAVGKNKISVRIRGIDLYTWDLSENITTVIRLETLVEKAFSEEAKIRALIRTLADLTKTVSEVETLHIESMSRPEYT
jgi:hypothetical protein